jgi:hypothetical protein
MQKKAKSKKAKKQKSKKTNKKHKKYARGICGRNRKKARFILIVYLPAKIWIKNGKKRD